MFEAVGRVVVVDEKANRRGDLDSPPAERRLSIIHFSNHSPKWRGKLGCPGTSLRWLAAQTMMGAARMVLDTGDHPALLKDAVTTPQGPRWTGSFELETAKWRVTLIKAVMKARSAQRMILESNWKCIGFLRPGKKHDRSGLCY